MPICRKDSKIIDNRIKKEKLLPKIDSSKDIISKKSIDKNSVFFPVLVFQLFVCISMILFFLIIKTNSYDKSIELANRIKYVAEGPTLKDAIGNIIMNLNKFLSNARNSSNLNNTDISNKLNSSSLKVEETANKKVENKIAVEQEKKNNNKEEKLDEIKDEKFPETKEIEKEFKKTEDEKAISHINLKSDVSSNSNKEKDISKTDKLNFVEPVKGYISSNYGLRKHPIFKEKTDFHHGIDIAVKDGTPIFSVEDGVVERTANTERSGNFITIKHNKGYESIYAHCSKILAFKGKLVKKGEVIALSGHSGKNITGSHLHFGLKKNGNWVDPSEILPKMNKKSK